MSAINTQPSTDAFRPPLVRFRGILKEEPVLVDREFDGRKSQQVQFNFTDLVVIESNEPYLFPIATITLRYDPNNRTGNAWDVFKKSMYKAFGDEDYGSMLDRLVGKEQEWWYGDCEMRMPPPDDSDEPPGPDGRPVWKMRPTKAWQIVSIEGVTKPANTNGKGLNEALVELLDGKTRVEFQAALFSPEGNALKAYGAEHGKAVEAASQQKLLPMLEAMNLVTVDADGVYHKVEA